MYRFEITKTPPFGYWVEVYDEQESWIPLVDYASAWTKKRAIQKAKRIAETHSLPKASPASDAEIMWYTPTRGENA